MVSAVKSSHRNHFQPNAASFGKKKNKLVPVQPSTKNFGTKFYLNNYRKYIISETIKFKHFDASALKSSRLDC